MHWLRWEKLTRAKKDGGIGFRDFTLFNKSDAREARMETDDMARLAMCQGTKREILPKL
jgi:hypothetical protein